MFDSKLILGYNNSFCSNSSVYIDDATIYSECNTIATVRRELIFCFSHIYLSRIHLHHFLHSEEFSHLTLSPRLFDKVRGIPASWLNSSNAIIVDLLSMNLFRGCRLLHDVLRLSRPINFFDVPLLGFTSLLFAFFFDWVLLLMACFMIIVTGRYLSFVPCANDVMDAEMR